MAISDIKEYAHLTDADVEALSDQLTSYPLEADGAAEYAAVPDAAARLVIHGQQDHGSTVRAFVSPVGARAPGLPGDTRLLPRRHRIAVEWCSRNGFWLTFQHFPRTDQCSGNDPLNRARPPIVDIRPLGHPNARAPRGCSVPVPNPVPGDHLPGVV
ncbi:hypothetical protein W59_20913 [Rhodococcus opacus RKJ300 = JCM 13270]|uniref:Uncharacterized protein n=1 Tax=Rhodococcus opacus RKJ300 = JCM 13270 TaxID=1165867 RepID=I0WN86_RHOOP|nr:hypothetical protein W59_20913 [Rhodococcus opacus RKJ300 = JCM 13270]